MKHLTAVPVAVCLFACATHAALLSTGFTYQGRLTDGSDPANGSYDLTFQLFDAVTNGAPVGITVTNAGVTVASGLFVTSLDFGAGVFDGNARWLEISARTNGAAAFSALSPRQPLTPTPYAIQAANAAGIRTPTNQAFELFVNNQRAMRIEPTSRGVNVISGSASNYVSPGVLGATISGGGDLFAPTPNFISADFATIGGGSMNRILATATVSTIGGGADNSIEFNAPAATISGGAANTNRADGATISGGTGNLIETNAHLANIAGGSGNTIRGQGATIAGGTGHVIGRDALNATIAGGDRNTISGYAYSSLIGGGYQNWINGAAFTSIASGYANIIQADAGHGSIGGGQNNTIQTSSDHAVIGGGGNNTIATSAQYAVISGGASNTVSETQANVGGGAQNTIQLLAAASTIAGGLENRIETNAFFSTIGGGNGNTIRANAYDSTIGGGVQNAIQNTAISSTIGGGDNNVIQANASSSTIAGGSANVVSNAASDCFIGGGIFNVISPAAGDSTITGGRGNTIALFADSSSIGGGSYNSIQSLATKATIAGGQANIIQRGAYNASIGGGYVHVVGTNAAFATIGGGYINAVTNLYGTVPGGRNNTAGGTDSFAAGHRGKANHQGAFVWADSSDFDFPSAETNEFAVRATGGVRFVSAIDVSGVPVAGVSLPAGSGSWSSLSDRNAKENLRPVDGRVVLEKVAALPLATWNYKSQNTAVRHIGPMAQDFRAAFGVGENDTTITTIDADGVALAAIQGLNQKFDEQLKEKDTRISALEKELAELKQAVRKLSDRKD
jgi:hypothetical protein